MTALIATLESATGRYPADRVPELFEPVRRLDEQVGNGQGNGLGLSTVQSVVAAHDGL